MKTKDKIIQAAITLFNLHGVTKISLRQIATEIGISHGNLAYHYKNKAVILDEIYSRMMTDGDLNVYPNHTEISLIHYHHVIQQIRVFRERYRFFYMDILEISRHYPEITQRYRETITKRRKQTKKLFDILIEKELIKPDPEPGFYQSLTHSIWILSVFWLQQEEVLGSNHPVLKAGNDVEHIWKILLPHLTEKGMAEYKSLTE